MPLQLLLEEGQGGFRVIRSPNSSPTPRHRLFEIPQKVCGGQGIVLQAFLYAAREKDNISVGPKWGKAESCRSHPEPPAPQALPVWN